MAPAALGPPSRLLACCGSSQLVSAHRDLALARRWVAQIFFVASINKKIKCLTKAEHGGDGVGASTRYDCVDCCFNGRWVFVDSVLWDTCTQSPESSYTYSSPVPRHGQRVVTAPKTEANHFASGVSGINCSMQRHWASRNESRLFLGRAAACISRPGYQHARSVVNVHFSCINA
eukprot:6194384-Pleurochrysis_carterae.AAC.1